jgi:hypothetical protein
MSGDYFCSSDLAHNRYTARQIDKIKGLIASLPPPRWKLFFFGGAFENQIHFAFYRDNTLHIYDYSQDEAKSELEEWPQIFQMNPGGS